MKTMINKFSKKQRSIVAALLAVVMLVGVIGIINPLTASAAEVNATDSGFYNEADGTQSATTFTTGTQIRVENVTRKEAGKDKYSAVYELTAEGTWQAVDKEKYVVWEGEGENTFHGIYPLANPRGTEATYEEYVLDQQYTEELLARADWMTATATATNSDDSHSLDLQFNHLLSKVTVKVVGYNSEYDSAPTIGATNFRTQVNIYADYSDGTPTVFVKAAPDLPISPLVTTNSEGQTEFTAILAPVKYEEGASFMEITVNGEVLTVPANDTLVKEGLKSGCHYTFELTVGKEKVELTEVKVSDWNDGGTITGGVAERDDVDLSTLTSTYIINDSERHSFYGSGSYGIKVESGNPTIVLNNAKIKVDGSNGSMSAIEIASGSNTTIQVLGDNTVDGDTYTNSPAGGIFVAEGATVNIRATGTEHILRVSGVQGAAAIGGKYDWTNSDNTGNGGSINIENVTVYADTNYYYAAAIGAAGSGTCGTINVKDAVVYAYVDYPAEHDCFAPGIGCAMDMNGEVGTIPVVNITDSEIHAYRGSGACAYIGYSIDSDDASDTSGIDCGGGSVKNSTIYCYTGLTATTTDKTVKYDADGNATKTQN